MGGFGCTIAVSLLEADRDDESQETPRHAHSRPQAYAAAFSCGMMRPLFFAHRGGSLLRPENTLPAFEHGMSFGADALELDIQQTRDGELVVIHDPTLDRTTSGSGPSPSYSLDEVRAFDAGYTSPPMAARRFPFADRA